MANSLAVKRWVHKWEHVADAQISVVFNGYTDAVPGEPAAACDPCPLDLPTRSRIVGVVANFKPIKRLDTLIMAFAQIAYQHPEHRREHGAGIE